MAQRCVLTLQRGRFQRPANEVQQAVGFKGLLDEVIGAAPDRCDRCLDIAVSADDDDRDKRIDRLHEFENRQAVHVAALQPHIQNDQSWRTHSDFFQGLFGCRCGSHRIVFILKHTRDQIADVRLIVYDKNIGAHERTSVVSTSASSSSSACFGNMIRTRAPLRDPSRSCNCIAPP